MAKLIKSHIVTQYGILVFDIHLNSSVVAINGDSGTGKTFLRNVLVTSNDEENPLYLGIDWKLSGYVDTLIKASKNKIILVDNVDIMLYPYEKYREIISKDKSNQYILFTRRGGEYGIPDKNVARLTRTGKHRIETFYPYEDEE